MVRKIFTNYIFLSLIIIFIGILNFYLNLKYPENNWFQRSGSLIVIFGATMSIRKLLSLNVKDAIDKEYIINGGNAFSDYMTEKEARNNIVSAYLGTFFMIIGTLIWSYGDLIFL
jgi:hypothetical protein